MSTCHRNGRKDFCVGQPNNLDELSMSRPALGTRFHSTSTWKLYPSSPRASIYQHSRILNSTVVTSQAKLPRSKSCQFQMRQTQIRAIATLHGKTGEQKHMRKYSSCPYNTPGSGLETLTGVLFALRTALWQYLVQGHRNTEVSDGTDTTWRTVDKIIILCVLLGAVL